ncbi:MAG: efflux RND transporter periplasmic adaptor subunit, partial [Armatimonadota bacterium]
AVAVIILLVAVAIVWSHSRPPQVSVADARMGVLELRIAASGLVEGESADLGFEGQGRITDLYVREGDSVAANQLLARIEPVAGPSAASPGGSGQANDDVIHAPHDGTVVQIYQRAGAVVAPGVPVLRVLAGGSRWVTAFIDSDDAAYLRRGQRMQCRAGGYLSQPWDIEVRAIGEEAVPRRDLPGSSRQVRVRCEPLSPAFALTPGTEVDVDGAVTIDSQALLVPAAAVVHDGSDDSVWVVENSTVRRQPVRLGPKNFDLIHISDGLQPGQTVVVHGKQGLTDGQRVRPAPMPPMRQPATEAADGS